MSLTPQRPDETADVADLKNRVRILEAEYPQSTPALIVTDGLSSDVIAPTSTLFIGPGLELSEPSPGEAEIVLPPYVGYTPTLTGQGGDPVLGAGGQIGGAYIRLRNFVQIWGSVNFGTSPAFGSGHWNFSLPAFLAGATGNALGQAFIQKDALGAGPPFYVPMQVLDSPGGLGVSVSFAYVDTPPAGTQKYFGGTDHAGWTLEHTDFLYFNLQMLCTVDP